ncbi:MAG: hypothetical protein KC656_00625, partial [Myxococcales bacterium]|nr:hypothetical protein [Myxococcales bacterium]
PFPYLAATLEDRLCTLAWHAGDPAAAYGHARAARATSERGITPLERVRGRMPLLLLLAIDRPEEALVEVDEALGITVPVGEVRWTHLLRLVRVGVLYTLQRDGDARAALTAVAGRAHTPQVRERHDLLRALLGVPVELPEGLEPWAEAGRLRDAVLRDEPGAREALVRHIDALGRPPRLFLASLEAAWRRLI